MTTLLGSAAYGIDPATLESSVDSNTDRTAERDPRDTPTGRATTIESSPEQTVLDVYRAALSKASLLTADEEVMLANDMRRSRANLVSALSRIPEAVGLFARALEQAIAGERRLSEVLHSPFADYENGASDGESGGRRTIRSAARRFVEQHAAWRDGRRSRRAYQALATDFIRLDPGLQFLWEASSACEALDLDDEGQIDARERALIAGSEYRSAHRSMVEGNLRLAYSVAQRFVGNGVETEDLIQAANLGVIRAAEKFNPDLGFKFSTYAYQWIRQALSKALADTSRTVRVAAHVHDDVVRVRQTHRRVEQTLGREPTVRELADELKMPEVKVERALRAGQRPLSLDAPVPELDAVSYGDLVDDPSAGPTDVVAAGQVTDRMRELVASLPKREAFIIAMRHGIGVREPRTLEEIGKMLQITRERTRQLESRAMNRLRERISQDMRDR